MEQFSGLRKFLLHNNIDPDLSIRVTRFLKHTFAMKHKALSKDGKVAILDMLSKSLHEELEVQRHNECLQDSGFLHELLLLVDVGQTGDEEMSQNVSNGFKQSFMLGGDELFSDSSSSKALICWFCGSLALEKNRYQSNDGGPHGHTLRTIRLEKNQPVIVKRNLSIILLYTIVTQNCCSQ